MEIVSACFLVSTARRISAPHKLIMTAQLELTIKARPETELAQHLRLLLAPERVSSALV